jgi:tetratricopeptide (TPR) repeat protein
MINPSSEEIAVLNETGYYTAYFGIDDDKMKNIPAGIYELIASIEGETSEPVKLEIKELVIPASIASGEEMLIKLGQYYWHAGDAAKGMIYANQLLQKDPVSLDGLSLKGDLLVLENSYAAALESYSKAVKEYYKQNGAAADPPEYLLKMITWLKQQSGS